MIYESTGPGVEISQPDFDFDNHVRKINPLACVRYGAFSQIHSCGGDGGFSLSTNQEKQ